MSTPPKNISFSIRLDKQLKTEAEELFGELGLSLGSAMNIFLRQSVRLKGFPFHIGLETTLGAERPRGKSTETGTSTGKES